MMFPFDPTSMALRAEPSKSRTTRPRIVEPPDPAASTSPSASPSELPTISTASVPVGGSVNVGLATWKSTCVVPSIVTGLVSGGRPSKGALIVCVPLAGIANSIAFGPEAEFAALIASSSVQSSKVQAPGSSTGSRRLTVNVGPGWGSELEPLIERHADSSDVPSGPVTVALANSGAPSFEV